MENSEKLYVLVYVDDCIVVGPEKDTDDYIETIGELLKIKKLATMGMIMN